uniref:helix-turn-helix domain-containing protein n=1 Tax=Microbacterium sp. BF1 TaxID=2821146 RepID=UPI001C4E1D43
GEGREAVELIAQMVDGAGKSASHERDGEVARRSEEGEWERGDVAAIPPLVLLSITHLTVILTRPTQTPTAQTLEEVPVGVTHEEAVDVRPVLEPAAPALLVGDRHAEAVQLREVEGWSNKRIARHMGVHPSTVGRWFTPTGSETREESP